MKPYVFPRKLIRPEDCADEEAGLHAGAWLTREQLAGTYDAKGNLARSHMPQRAHVLELGVRAGYSAEVFLASGARSYVGIDATNGSWWGPTHRDLVIQAMDELGARYPHRDIVYTLADSHDRLIQEQIARLGPFDLIHFDGDQFYDGALQDLTDYMPLLTPGGLAIIDGPPPFSGFHRAPRDWARRNGFVVRPEGAHLVIDGYEYPRDLVLRRATEPEQVIVPGPALGMRPSVRPSFEEAYERAKQGFIAEAAA